MQFTIDRDTFIKALGRVQGIVEKRTTIPILSNVLIQAEENQIYLIATDLEVGMKASYPADIAKTGKITVSAKKIYEIIRELPDDKIHFTAKENSWIEIRCGKALFNIVGLSSDEFPYFPETEGQKYIRIKPSQLREMIDKTIYAVSTDDTKYNLNGIFIKQMEVDGRNVLRMVATDGHRLALIDEIMPHQPIPQLDKGVILPRKGIQELRKVAEDDSESMELAFLDNNAVVRRDRTTIVMRLVDGDFPDYNRVIPQTREQKVDLQRDPFFHALRRIAILANERSRGIKVRLGNGILEISSSNPDFGEAREDMEIDYPGPEVAIGFNARYLGDILQTMEGERVEMFFKDHISPALFTTPARPGYLTVVMPMRL